MYANHPFLFNPTIQMDVAQMYSFTCLHMLQWHFVHENINATMTLADILAGKEKKGKKEDKEKGESEDDDDKGNVTSTIVFVFRKKKLISKCRLFVIQCLFLD